MSTTPATTPPADGVEIVSAIATIDRGDGPFQVAAAIEAGHEDDDGGDDAFLPGLVFWNAFEGCWEFDDAEGPGPSGRDEAIAAARALFQAEVEA